MHHTKCFLVQLFEVRDVSLKNYSCLHCTIKIRERFPEETGIYRNFEDDNTDDGISEIVEAWEYIGDVKEE